MAINSKYNNRFATDEEKQLISFLDEDSQSVRTFLEQQEKIMLKAMHFAIHNPSRAARILVINHMMSMEDYLNARF